MKQFDMNEEVVLLLASLDIINSIVNKSAINFLGGKDGEYQLQFPTDAHMKYFSIILLEFLSKPNLKPEVKDLTFLSALRSISSHPNLYNTHRVAALKESTEKFEKWLSEEVVYKDLWFSSISKNVDMKLRRIEYIRICGNISKHSFLRLSYNASLVKDIFKSSDVVITTKDALLLLDDFYEWFYTNFLHYHFGTIAEHLNDIRLGIFEYLKDEFQRAYYKKPGEDEIMYHYHIPLEITEDYYKANYWNLMNRARSGPYMGHFKSLSLLKLRY